MDSDSEDLDKNIPFSKNPQWWPHKLNPYITRFSDQLKEEILTILENLQNLITLLNKKEQL